MINDIKSKIVARAYGKTFSKIINVLNKNKMP
jgi:hypothetical protein